nr:CAP domain-containing protein [Paenibacillus pinihumi]
MKKLIAITATLLLIAGCSSTNQPMNIKPNRVETKSRHTVHKAQTHVTQASSTALPNSGKSSVRMKEVPGGGNPLDLLIGGDGLGGVPGTINPAVPNAPAAPNVPGTPAKQPANQTDNTNQTAGSSAFVQQVLDLVNQERSKAGLNSLSTDNKLDKVALDKAKDLYDNNYFDHQSPTYGSPFDMMKSYGVNYNTAGENIAKGQTSPQEVMSQWMNSPGHRANILNNTFKNIGIGYYNNTWVQEFTG